MRSHAAARRAVMAAAAGCASVLLAACGSAVEFRPSPGNSEAAGPRYEAGDLMVSDGTDTVMIDGNPVKFPTTVTDAAWSHDGSRIAFVDADNNIATARPDGSELIVLTKAVEGVRRSSPTWNGPSILYTYWATDGSSQLRTVPFIAQADEPQEQEFRGRDEDAPATNNAAPSAGRDGEVAFQHAGRDGLEVWVVDTNARVPESAKRAMGGAAEVSPDGSKVAFVAPNGQVSVVPFWEGEGGPEQVTFGVDSPSHLAWSPDSTRIAFRTPAGVASVTADVPDGASANPVTELSSTSGTPSFVPPPLDALFRIDTTDLVAATIAMSTQHWPSFDRGQTEATSVVIVPADDADIMARSFGHLASPRPGGDQGPVLLSQGGGLDPRVRDEVRRLLGTNSSTPSGDEPPQVLILGDPDGISAQAEQDLRGLGYSVRRVANDDLTDERPAAQPQYVQQAIVADVGDPMAAALAGATYGEYVFFSDAGKLGPDTTGYLNGVSADATIRTVGPGAARAMGATWPNKPKWSVTALPADPDEYTRTVLGAGRGVVLVDRTSPRDLVVAVALAKFYGFTVLAVDPAGPLPASLRDMLSRNSGLTNQVMTLGSGGRLDVLESSVLAAVGGPLGHVSAAPERPPMGG